MRLCQEKNQLVSAVCIGENDRFEDSATPLLLEARRQLEEYFSGARSAFDLPLCIRGTAFEQSVYHALLSVPYGETRTYGELARMIGRPGAARAVGRACGQNPLLIFVPCHRIVGTGGRLTGFAAGTEAKRTLLLLEAGHKQS
ncbi:MAG: methylated-DNA--[Clostridia bacterium]|nr:methylated-DNA--[protein]-cysteine S-methyltransferase [Clostridia bacterium]